MFTIWDVAARPSHYDWQQVSPVARMPQTEAWEENLREPGEQPGRRPETDDARRAPRRDPYRVALEKQRPARRVQARTAQDLMTTPVVFLTPDDTVAAAWDLVRERRFRHVPILDGVRDGEAAGGGPTVQRLVGIVSDRDLLRVAGTPEHVPTDDVSDRPLRTLMCSPVFSAHPDTPVREVARVMFHEHIGAMPICSHAGELVGILTRSDVLRALLSEGPLQLWI